MSHKANDIYFENKFEHMRFCQLCHNELQENETQKCVKCIKDPMWSIVDYYGKHDEHNTIDVGDSDHIKMACTDCEEVL